MKELCIQCGEETVSEAGDICVHCRHSNEYLSDEECERLAKMPRDEAHREQQRIVAARRATQTGSEGSCQREETARKR